MTTDDETCNNPGASSARERSFEQLTQRLQRCGYLPRFMSDGKPCAVVERGCSPHRTFVASMPKSGTYLVAEVLSALGLQSSKLHVDEGWTSDFREFRPGTFMWKYKLEMPLEDALQLVLPGQFAVGHLPPTETCLRVLRGFRTVFVFRELRRALVSWARFVIAERMDGGAATAAERLPDGPELVWWVLTQASSTWLMPNYNEMVAWLTVHDALAVRFEDLAGDNGPAAQATTIVRLARHLDVSVAAKQAEQIASACVGSKTLTYSGARSVLAGYWNDRLENWFRSVGGPALNKALGYDEAPLDAESPRTGSGCSGVSGAM